MTYAAIGTGVSPDGGVSDTRSDKLSAEAITGGDVLVESGGQLEVGDADNMSGKTFAGVAIGGCAAANQVVAYAPPGTKITGLSGLTPGQAYYLGNSGDSVKGQIGLYSDAAAANAASGTQAVLVGLAMSASELYIIGKDSGQTAT